MPLKGKGLAALCSDVPCSLLGGGGHDNWSWRTSERDKVMLVRKYVLSQDRASCSMSGLPCLWAFTGQNHGRGYNLATKLDSLPSSINTTEE